MSKYREGVAKVCVHLQLYGPQFYTKTHTNAYHEHTWTDVAVTSWIFAVCIRLSDLFIFTIECFGETNSVSYKTTCTKFLLIH